MDSTQEAEPNLLQLSILDEATQKLLESDEDDTKALERYDTGDPQYMSKAYDDMRKLESILQERFAYENGLRTKRKRHLKRLQETLSEFQITEASLQRGGREAENTRKFFSATNLQFQAATARADGSHLTVDESVQIVSVSEEGARTRSCGSSLSIPQRISTNELEGLESRWALVPLEEDLDENFNIKDETGSDNAKASKLSFQFHSVPPPVDHVKRNIQLAGQFFTPIEKTRLDELLAEPDPSSQDLTPVYTNNPFSLFGEDLKALQAIDEMLVAVHQSHDREQTSSSIVPSSTFGSGLQGCRFGFQKGYCDADESDANSRRFTELNKQILAIEQAEQHMLERIFEGSEVEPLERTEKIVAALQNAETELLSIMANGPERNSEEHLALVPFVSEAVLQLLLGPFPRCTNYSELNRRQWNTESFSKWKDWLEERRLSLGKVHSEMERTRIRCENKDGNEEVIAAQKMKEKFHALMLDLRTVKAELDVLISANFSDAQSLEHEPIPQSPVVTVDVCV
ncbi:hypothetical protein BV898_03258 [Hypsibius exemplaris]|uniref:Uncharacterized protein n=1 Tax=Hypsibius exemplaris TaxID=2072580 RepID=A0A1W0X622_HYPEX|nr:hypothetical protein BV898_03258 [Hypsibius exemplaris]